MAYDPLRSWYAQMQGDRTGMANPYADVQMAAQDAREQAAQQIRAQAASVQSANPFAVGRQAALATADAMRPIAAQQAQQMAARRQQLAAEQRAYQLAGQERADRFLAAGLNAASGGLGTLLTAFGGGGAGAGARGTAQPPQPMQQPMRVAQQAAPSAPRVVAQLQPLQASAQPPMIAGAPQITDDERERAGGILGAAQGLSPLLGLVPGYGQLAQLGIGGLGALMGRR